MSDTTPQATSKGVTTPQTTPEKLADIRESVSLQFRVGKLVNDVCKNLNTLQSKTDAAKAINDVLICGGVITKIAAEDFNDTKKLKAKLIEAIGKLKSSNGQDKLDAFLDAAQKVHPPLPDDNALKTYDSRNKAGTVPHMNPRIDAVKYVLQNEAMLEHTADFFDRVVGQLESLKLDGTDNKINAAVAFGSNSNHLFNHLDTDSRLSTRYLPQIIRDYQEAATALRAYVEDNKHINAGEPREEDIGTKLNGLKRVQSNLSQVISLGENNIYLVSDMVKEAAALNKEYQKFKDNSINTNEKYDPTEIDARVTEAMGHIVDHSGAQKGRTVNPEDPKRKEAFANVDALTAEDIHAKIVEKAEARGKEWAEESDTRHTRTNRFAQAVKNRRTAQEAASTEASVS